MATKDKYEMRSPCSSCPYRRDAPLAMWSKKEFDDLRRADADPIFGTTYGCHGEASKAPKDRGICVGWALDQQRRREPSIQFRIQLNNSAALREQYTAISDGGHELYDSIAEMCEANFPGDVDRPRPVARQTKRTRRRRKRT